MRRCGSLRRQREISVCRDFKGEQEIYHIDAGVIALEDEVRALERQAAQELGQFRERPEDRERAATLAERLKVGRERARQSEGIEAAARAERRAARRAEEQGCAPELS